MAPPGDGLVVVDRHRGETGYTLPHLIDHLAKRMAAPRSAAATGCWRSARWAGCTRSSARGRLSVRTTSSRWDSGRCRSTTSARTASHGSTCAGGRVLEGWPDRVGSPIVDGGVYWQTRGPRLETPAEIGLIAAHATVVGMTIASECLAAAGDGLAYAAICVVDNLANGVGERALTIEELRGQSGCGTATRSRRRFGSWCRRWHEPGGRRRRGSTGRPSACEPRGAGSRSLGPGVEGRPRATS